MNETEKYPIQILQRLKLPRSDQNKSKRSKLENFALLLGRLRTIQMFKFLRKSKIQASLSCKSSHDIL